jgi:hypothetical protein
VETWTLNNTTSATTSPKLDTPLTVYLLYNDQEFKYRQDDTRTTDHQHCDAPDLRTPNPSLPRTPGPMSNSIQLYLAVFMELISFPEKIQKDVVPVVSKSSRQRQDTS